MIGPKLSSRITAIVWSTSVSTVGANQLPGARRRACRRRAAWRPWLRASATCASSTVELRRARERADVGRRRPCGSPTLKPLHRRRRSASTKASWIALVHVDALDRAAALAGVVERAVGEASAAALRRRRRRRRRPGPCRRARAAACIMRARHRLRRSSRRWRSEPVKNTPSTRLLEQRRADVAAADHRDEHVGGHAGLVQQLARCAGR